MADWHTKLKPVIEKELAAVLLRLEQPALPADKTEFLRGEIYALRLILDAAKERPKPE